MKRMTTAATGMVLICLMTAAGCSETQEESETAAPPVRTAAGSPTYRKTASELRRELRANEMAKFDMSGNDIVGAKLFRSGVKSIEPLKGLPLISIDLGMTPVSDLTPLQGMPLEEVVLENTPVTDLSPLQGMSLRILKLQNTAVQDLSPIQGMPLEQLNLMGVPITDLSFVKDMPLEILWIPGTDVTDLSPLAGSNLISLDIQGTEVADLTPLTTMPRLQRLNIADTPVTDISVLRDLRLTRITLTPSTIQSGMDDLRAMESLTEIQTSMQSPLSAEDFWKRYDLDLFSDPAAADADTVSEGEASSGGDQTENPAADQSEPDDASESSGTTPPADPSGDSDSDKADSPEQPE